MQLVYRWIACLIRNSLSIHRGHKPLNGDTGKLFGVYVENVRVLAIPRGARLTFKFVVVGNDDAALTGSHQFAGLETEGAGNTESPDALSAPLAGVSVSAVLN